MKLEFTCGVKFPLNTCADYTNDTFEIFQFRVWINTKLELELTSHNKILSFTKPTNPNFWTILIDLYHCVARILSPINNPKITPNQQNSVFAFFVSFVLSQNVSTDWDICYSSWLYVAHCGASLRGIFEFKHLADNRLTKIPLDGRSFHTFVT